MAVLPTTLRGGLWYEDYLREEFRDWHRVIDSSARFRFDDVAYRRQYDREYPVDIFMYYLEDTIKAGFVTARVGIRQFLVHLPVLTCASSLTTLPMSAISVALPVARVAGSVAPEPRH